MKKNLQKIPSLILEQIRTFDQDDVIVAAVKKISVEELADYKHLGIVANGVELVLPSPQLPDPEAGRYSHANVYGKEIIRKDLPKFSKDFGHMAPSWGSGGYHWVSQVREVYQRDFLPPKQVELSLTYVGKQQNFHLVKFAIDQVINRRTPNFETELLYNLNILQESIGTTAIYTSTTTLSEYAASVKVDWQLLPPGTVDEVIAAMLHGKRSVSAEGQKVMRERVGAMSKLKPEAYVTGTDGFLRYFGAKFGEDFVAFENLHYGNALYILHEGWELLSKKSRIEILAGNSSSFDRILHKEGWIDQLKHLVNVYRSEKRRGS